MAGSEVPIVLVNVMRGGPGLGSIGPSQSDYFQMVKGHGHGDYRMPVLAPSSIAEAIELVADAFELAERYRTPVIILADGALGQAMEPVVPAYRMPARAARRLGRQRRGRATAARRQVAPPQPEDLEEHNRAPPGEVPAHRGVRGPLGRRDARGRRARRSSPTAPRRASPGRRSGGPARSGLRVGPVPPDHASGRSHRRRSPRSPARARAMLVVELSAGQMVEDVRLAVEGRTPVAFHGRTGGMVPPPDEVLAALRRLWAVTEPEPPGTADGGATRPHRPRRSHRVRRAAVPPGRHAAELLDELVDVDIADVLKEVWR